MDRCIRSRWSGVSPSVSCGAWVTSVDTSTFLAPGRECTHPSGSEHRLAPIPPRGIVGAYDDGPGLWDGGRPGDGCGRVAARRRHLLLLLRRVPGTLQGRSRWGPGRAGGRSNDGPERRGMSMYGYASKKDDLRSRLRKIEGQVRGLQRMVDEDKYCIDILTQVNSV